MLGKSYYLIIGKSLHVLSWVEEDALINYDVAWLQNPL